MAEIIEALLFMLKLIGPLALCVAGLTWIVSTRLNTQIKDLKKDIKGEIEGVKNDMDKAILKLTDTIKEWTRTHLDDRYVSKDQLLLVELRLEHLEERLGRMSA